MTGELLKVLKDRPFDRKSAQQYIGLKSQSNFRERYLEAAFSNELVEVTLSEKPNSLFQKYRLTEKGRALISSLPNE